MKLARIVDPNFHSALDKLATQQLPIKVAYRLKGAVKTVREEFAKYEEIRQAALSKYGKKDETGALVMGKNNSVQFESEDLAAFVKEINELANEEINIQTISMSELGDAITMSLVELEQLEGFITD